MKNLQDLGSYRLWMFLTIFNLTNSMLAHFLAFFTGFPVLCGKHFWETETMSDMSGSQTDFRGHCYNILQLFILL